MILSINVHIEKKNNPINFVDPIGLEKQNIVLSENERLSEFKKVWPLQPISQIPGLKSQLRRYKEENKYGQYSQGKIVTLSQDINRFYHRDLTDFKRVSAILENEEQWEKLLSKSPPEIRNILIKSKEDDEKITDSGAF